MRKGQRLGATQQDSITATKSARERFLAARLHLPSYLLGLGESSQPFPVHYSAQLEEMCDRIRKTLVKSSFVSSSQADLGRKLA
jgi:hypothetical protein